MERSPLARLPAADRHPTSWTRWVLLLVMGTRGAVAFVEGGLEGACCTALKLIGDDARTLCLTVTGAWTETAASRIEAARS